ncbi:MAG: hypothetical protein KQA41_03920 [Candidatus Aenigmarchaeota archaeon]|nr:hypothetical protein [Candidatus Aenigmarchaeota archaeon]
MKITRREFLKILLGSCLYILAKSFLQNQPDWSIGIFKGSQPKYLKPYENNPVLKAQDVKDLDAVFLADPFIILKDGNYYMFFEVMGTDGRGRIGLAISDDGFGIMKE